MQVRILLSALIVDPIIGSFILCELGLFEVIMFILYNVHMR